MKYSRLFLALLLGITAACDRAPVPDTGAAQREADEKRMVELRDLEQRASDREAAARTAQLDAEQASLELEKADLTDAQRAANAERLAKLKADERRLDQQRADEKAAAERAKSEAAANARTAQKLDFFYDALDPAGDWIELDPFGYVWQPREAQRTGWRPYTDGSWVWTDYGWTWASNEKFGWATYHYGRWTRVKRIGWVWVPGSEWAPAWVAWRRSDSFVGWAPLPPDAHSGSGFTAAVDSYYDIGPASYSFVPVENFGEQTYVGRVVEPERNGTIVNNTVNVTNISYKTVENKKVIFNAGPELTVIDQRSRVPVKQLRVERVSDRSAVGPAVESGKVLRIAAPVIVSAARAATAPARVKERVKAGEIEHGWSGVNDPKAARVKLADEARVTEQVQRSGAGTATPKDDGAQKAAVQAEAEAAVKMKRDAAKTEAASAQAARDAAQEKADAERKAAALKKTHDEAAAKTERKADAAQKAAEESAAKEAMKQQKLDEREMPKTQKPAPAPEPTAVKPKALSKPEQKAERPEIKREKPAPQSEKVAPLQPGTPEAKPANVDPEPVAEEREKPRASRDKKPEMPLPQAVEAAPVAPEPVKAVEPAKVAEPVEENAEAVPADAAGKKRTMLKRFVAPAGDVAQTPHATEKQAPGRPEKSKGAGKNKAVAGDVSDAAETTPEAASNAKAAGKGRGEKRAGAQ